MMSVKAEKTNQFQADLVKGITDGAFNIDLQKKVNEFNRAFIKLHHIEPRQINKIKTQPCHGIVQLEICKNNCILDKVLAIQDTVRFDEVRGHTSTGEDLTLIVTAIPIKNASGEIEGILELHRNVSDEAKIHDKYKILLDKEKLAKEELEKLVEARTMQLKKANDDLKKAEAHLVHSEKMSSLGQMVAGIAHELNNPINFIAGNIDILDEYTDDIRAVFDAITARLKDGGSFTDQDYQAIEKKFDLKFKVDDLKGISTSVRKGSERAVEVIQGMRTFSRLDEAQLKETDIHQDIDTTLMILRNQYKDRIDIKKDYEPMGLFKCFSSQLNQVYMNLLQNAIHAISGSGTITIRTRLEENHLRIDFQDSGCGMPKEVQAKIFDPFFTTKPVGQGTGLGLAVTYGIIQKHQGSITVTSEEGQGTTFSILIPKNIEVNE